MQQKTFSYSYAHPLFRAPFIVVGDGAWQINQGTL
jgi:hypothetical protein